MNDAILCMMLYFVWCNIMHYAILCMMQYYAWCNIMHGAILCKMHYYAWYNIMHDAILCMMHHQQVGPDHPIPHNTLMYYLNTPLPEKQIYSGYILPMLIYGL